MPNRLRVRLLLSYLFLSLNLILLAGITFYYFKRAEELRNTQSKTLEADLKLQKLINTDLLIINRETAKNEFFKTGKSHLISEHQFLIEEIKRRMNQIKEISNSAIEPNLLLQIDSTLIKYNDNFTQYLHIVIARGFQDYGIEGKMRDKAHLLEEMNIVTKEELLYLRRHEKDFFLRKDMVYVGKFNRLCDKVSQQYKSTNPSPYEQELLESYCALFNEIVKIDIELGLSENEGFRKKLHSHVIDLEEQFSQLLKSSEDVTQRKLKKGELLFYISMAFSLGLSVWLSVYFSTQIANPVKIV